MKRKFILLTVMLGIGSCAPAMAQKGKVAAEESLKAQIDSALLSKRLYPSRPTEQHAADFKSIPSLYQRGLQNPTVGNFILSQLLSTYVSDISMSDTYAAELSATTKAEVDFLSVVASQNQILIQQNKQIITLLTKIANKK